MKFKTINMKKEIKKLEKTFEKKEMKQKEKFEIEQRIKNLEIFRERCRYIFLGILFIFLLIFSILISYEVSAQSTLNIKPYHIRPHEKSPTPERVSKTISSGGGGCITSEWVWNGNDWQGRDLIFVHGNILNGKYCVVWDMVSKRKISKPTNIPESEPMSYYNAPIDAGWWRT